MMKWWKMFSKSHKGFSLVEIICAVAVLSIVITGAGSAMVISARSYQRSNTELDLQQQAQITANLLTNLIIDSNKIEIFDGGKTLTIAKDEPMISYKITLDEGANELKYEENDSGDKKTLAEHINNFSIRRVSENNYDFSLEVISADGRTFSSDYHVTPRNSASVSSLTGMTGGDRAIIFAENVIVLEPNEVYDLNVTVTNAQTSDPTVPPFSIKDIVGRTDDSTTIEIPDRNTVRIKMGRNEKGTGTDHERSFRIILEAANADELAVEVRVRRVTKIAVSGQKLEGSAAKAGAVYNITAATDGTWLSRVAGAWYDINYKPTYPVTWEVRGEGLYGSWTDYVDVVASNGDISNPFYQLKLKQDIPTGGAIKIIAVAKHPAGTDGAGNFTNKSGLQYDVIQGEYVIRNATTINRGASGDADRTTFSFNVGDLGQLRKVVEAVYQTKIQANWSGTTNASYNAVKQIWDNKSIYERNGNEALDYFNARNPISYAQFRYVIDEEKSDESKWSPWIPMGEYSGGTPMFRENEADYFRPDKDYVLQVKVSFIESGNPSIVYWPLEDTEQDLYMTEYFVSKVSISDMYFEWWVWPEGAKTTKGNSTMANIPKNQEFYIKIDEVIGYSQNGAGSKMYIKIEREVSEGVWETATVWPGSKGGAIVEFINVKLSTPGKYRILPYMQDVSYKESVDAEVTKVSYDLYDLSTGEGIVYFNIVD